MRYTLMVVVLASLQVGTAQGQTEEDVNKLIQRLVELDSIDLARDVKFQYGLEPSLYTLDADESKMKVLKNPYEVQGQNKPGAAGWYRVSFVVPEKLGKITLPKNGYNLGIETNVLGSWEAYTYINGKPAGLWSKDGMLMARDQPATVWVSNAPMPTKPGDKITVAILALASPLGRGSPDGFALRHFRLRFALGHTAARQPFYGALHSTAEKLRTLKGDELTAFQAKVKEPLDSMKAVFESAESGKLDDLTKAMQTAGKDLATAIKK